METQDSKSSVGLLTEPTAVKHTHSHDAVVNYCHYIISLEGFTLAFIVVLNSDNVTRLTGDERRDIVTCIPDFAECLAKSSFSTSFLQNLQPPIFLGLLGAAAARCTTTTELNISSVWIHLPDPAITAQLVLVLSWHLANSGPIFSPLALFRRAVYKW